MGNTVEFLRYAGILDEYAESISEDQLSAARHHVDPDLLKEKDLGDKLTTLRKITKLTNGDLAAQLQENKRTFESWIAGRYVPEGDKLKKVNRILITAGISYIETVMQDRTPNNIYTGFPTLYRISNSIQTP